MAEAYLNGKAGKWRTVGGRRIFIEDGQSLEDAMKASGKFDGIGNNKKDGLNAMSKNEITSKIFSKYPDIDEEDEDYLNSLSKDELIKEVKDRGWKLDDKNTPKDMDEGDIRSEINSNRIKMKDATGEEKRELINRNHELMTELDNRWSDSENKFKAQKEAMIGKTIEMKGGDKTEYEVLDVSKDSQGKNIYKVMEDGEEKWVQGDLFKEKSGKSYSVDGKKVTEADLKAEYKKEYAKGNVTESYDDWKQEVTGNRNSNVKTIDDKIHEANVRYRLQTAKANAEASAKEYEKYNNQYKKYADLASEAGYGTPEYEKYSAKRSEAYKKAQEAKTYALTEFNKTVPYDEMFDSAKVISGSKNAKFKQPELINRDGKVYTKFETEDIKADTGVFGSVLKGAKLQSFNSELYIDENGEPTYWGSLSLRYQHNGGGTNGMELMNYRYNGKTGWDITDSAGYKYKNGKKITTVSGLTNYYMEYYGYSKENAKAMAKARLEELSRRDMDIDY